MHGVLAFVWCVVVAANAIWARGCDPWMVLLALETWGWVGFASLLLARSEDHRRMRDVHLAEARHLERQLDKEIRDAYLKGWRPRANA